MYQFSLSLSIEDCNCPVGELCTIQEGQLKCECGKGKERHADGTCQWIPGTIPDRIRINSGFDYKNTF